MSTGLADRMFIYAAKHMEMYVKKKNEMMLMPFKKKWSLGICKKNVLRKE